MPSILVTDSDDTMCDLLKVRLSGHGYNVFIAQDGLQGLKTYEKVKPKLVIMDLMLPAMNGYQLIHTIKNKDRGECKIIVLSGGRAENEIERCFDLGAADYIRKPFSPIELDARIRKQLEPSQYPAYKEELI